MRRLLWVPLLLAGCRTEFNVEEIRRLLSVDEVVDVGGVPVGQALGFQVVLESIAGGDIEVGQVDLVNADGPFFSHDGVLPYVPGGGAGALDLSYLPMAADYHHAVVTIASNAADPGIDIVVRGHGVDTSVQAWPLVVDFGPVAPPGYASREVTLYNEGNVDVEIGDAVIDAPFVLATALPLTLPAGQSRKISILFNVVEAKAATGALQLDAGELIAVPSIALRGNACETGVPALYDLDADGWTVCAGDCDDTDPLVSPSGTETFDFRDEDCDGLVDEDTLGTDDDGDGYSELEGDCNDYDPKVGPHATEITGNGVDDDCDGVVDLGSTDGDADGYSRDGGDCDDADAAVHPGAPELPDGKDQDCDGIIDEGTIRFDDDGDGFCESSAGCEGTAKPGDCDDTSDEAELRFPGADELPNGVDDDCDGDVDEGTDLADDDGDGFTEKGGDCDDSDPAVSPAAREILGNGIDDDCDGVVK